MALSSDFANASQRDKDDLLLKAAEKNDLDAVKTLLDAGAHAAVKNPWDGKTALHYAARHDNAEMAKLLISHGADVNDSDIDARTPLFTAMRGKAVAEVLLDKGAFPNARTMQGWTPLHEAVEAQNADVAKLLVAHGADPFLPCLTGETPADIANKRGCKEISALFENREPRMKAASPGRSFTP